MAYQDVVRADHPTLLWRVGEAMGSSSVADSTGDGLSGSPTGGVTLGVPGLMRADANTAAHFNGTDGVVVQDVLSNYAPAVLADAPLSYWPLDDPGTYTDATGHGYDLAAVGSGTITSVAGPLVGTTAPHFPGVADTALQRSSSFSYTLASGGVVQPFSVEFWLNQDSSSPDYATSFYWGTTTAYATGSAYIDADTTVGGIIELYNQKDGGSSVSKFKADWLYTLADSWHHVVLVYPGDAHASSSAIYIDGALAGSMNTSSTPLQHTQPSGTMISIGDGAPGFDNPLAGAVGHLAFYDHALSATTVEAHWAARDAGTALPPAASIELWLQTTTTQGGVLAQFASADGTHRDYTLAMHNDGTLVFRCGTTEITSPQHANTGHIKHVVATLDGSGAMSLWLQANQVASASGVSVGSSFTGRWQVGGGNTTDLVVQPSSPYFAGTIDEVAIYLNSPYRDAVLADNPLAWWPLADTGTTAHDASGHGLTLNTEGSGTILTGQSGPGAGIPAMHFDGSIRLERDGSTSLPAGQHAWTLECWLNRDPVGGTGNLILQIGVVSGFGTIYTLHADGATGLNPYWYGYDLHQSGLTDMQSSWHHYAVVFDGLRRTVYLDGDVVSGDDDPQTGEVFDNSQILLGGDGSADNWTGLLCQVAVYGTALSAGRVLAHVAAMPRPPYSDQVLASAPLAYWKLDEAGGSSTVADTSGAGRTGTPTSGVTLGTSGGLPAGLGTTQCASFDGTGQISFSPGGLPTSGPSTLEAWINPGHSGSTANHDGPFTLLDYGTNPVGRWLVLYGTYPSGPETLVDLWGDWSGTDQQDATLDANLDGTWHHVVATFDGSTTHHVYLDGVLLSALTYGSTAVSSFALTAGLLGVRLDAFGSFQGLMAHVAIYDSALSAATVLAHFEAA